MFSNKSTLIGLVLSLFLFPSCIKKYYELSNMEFHQGHDLEDEREALDDNLKSVTIYDQFETKAIFDVIYQSDSVRRAYVDQNCRKKGKNEQEKNALLRRQLEENKHWIAFYVLADVRDKTRLSLSEKNSNWSLYLQLQDGRMVMPMSIKEVELAPEYQFFFGPRFNLFKRSYHIKFPANDLDNKPYLQIGESFKLMISSAYKETCLKFKKTVLEKKVEKVEKKEELSSQRKKHAKFSTIKELKKSKKKTKKRKILKNEDYYWL